MSLLSVSNCQSSSWSGPGPVSNMISSWLGAFGHFGNRRLRASALVSATHPLTDGHPHMDVVPWESQSGILPGFQRLHQGFCFGDFGDRSPSSSSTPLQPRTWCHFTAVPNALCRPYKPFSISCRHTYLLQYLRYECTFQRSVWHKLRG